MAARSVPVGEELGSVGNTHAVVLSDSREEVAGDQKFISDSNSNAGSDLVFPLSRHDLGVSARNGNTSEEAGLVVDVSNAATEGSVGTYRAVVGTLSSGVSIVGPAEGVASELGGSGDESVLLLNSVPGLLIEIRIPNLFSVASEVGVSGDQLLVGGVFPHVGLTEDDDVVSLSEGVTVVRDGLDVNLRVLGGGHVARRAIKVPHGEVLEFLNFLGKSAALGAESDTGSVKPDVLGDNFTTLIDAEGVLVLTLKVTVFEV